MYKFAESTIKEQFEVAENDEIVELLQESVVEEDEFLRYRISERYNSLMKSLFDAHKKDALPEEQMSVIQEMKDDIQTYLANTFRQGGKKRKYKSH